MRVTIIGTGYVGLVSGACLADLGHTVVCVDTDQAKIDRLQQGNMPIYETGLEELVKRNVAHGRLAFTLDYAQAIPGAEIISLAVGTPSTDDGSVDMQYVLSAAEQVAKHLTGYAVIADKSTVPVGTSERVAAIIRGQHTGDFDVVSNPEFLREGRAVRDFMQPSRIVIGAASERARAAMLRLYSGIDCQKITTSPRSAELTKYAANAFLATKISFINELALLSSEVGADIEEVAKGIGSDPRIGKEFLRAGLGWGGSCFPKDVRAVLHLAREHKIEADLIQAACSVNARARARVIENMERHLNGLAGKTIALLGLAFKNDTDDTRESPATDLLRQCLAKGARVKAYDPAAVIYDETLNQRFERCTDVWSALEAADAALIATEWEEFRSLDIKRVRESMRGTLLVDGRNLFSPASVRQAGLDYQGIGRN